MFPWLYTSANHSWCLLLARSQYLQIQVPFSVCPFLRFLKWLQEFFPPATPEFIHYVLKPPPIFSCCTNQVSKNLLEVARSSLISRLKDLMETGANYWSDHLCDQLSKVENSRFNASAISIAGNSSSCLHQRRQDETDWLDLTLPNTTHMADIRRVPFPSKPTTIWYLHKRLKFLLVHFL